MSAMTEIALTCDSEIHRDHPQGRRPEASAPPLRLTRRGRIVIAVAAVLLVTLISLLAAGVAQATSHGPAPRAARQDLLQVVVRPGQTLWSVAESADPDQDTRVVVQQIIDLNSLAGATVSAGQQLWVPRG
jgi:LysM domain-containing protein